MKIVHVVGTGTIGEPLIGLLADNRDHFGIDEVTFHKRTPLLTERAKVNDLVSRGAVLSVDDDARADLRGTGTRSQVRDTRGHRAGHGGHRLHPGGQ